MALTDLAGFPMVMAVSQEAINGQMAKVYGQSTHGPDQFPHVPWDKLGPEDGSWALVVDQFEAPEVDFDTTVVNGCRLKMTISSGHFSTFSVKIVNGTPTVNKIDQALDGLVFYITTPMKQVVHDTWSDELFEVQGLFADLENMHRLELHLSEDLRIAIGGSIKSALETVLADRIKELGAAHPKGLLFGAVKIPKIEQSKQSSGPLKPSASTFSTLKTTDVNGHYVSGNLNYLLLLGDDKTIPRGAAVGAFNHSLIQSDADATLVLSGAALLETYVKPILESSWAGIKLKMNPRGLFGAVSAKMSIASTLNFGMTIDGRGRNAYLTKCDATVQGNKIVIDYYFETSIYHWSGDIKADVTGQQTIELSVVNGEITQKVTSPKPNVHTHGGGAAGVVFGDILSFGFDEIGRNITAGKGTKSINDFSNSITDDAEKALNAMVMPGKVVWRFLSAVLDGQLYLTATYK